MAINRKYIIKALLFPWKHSELGENLRRGGSGFQGIFLLLGLGLLFSLTSFIQAATGNFPAVPIVLPITLENYFFWQALLVMPWVVASYILVVLVARLFLMLAGAESVNVRQLKAYLGLSFSFCLFWLWIPHLLTAVFYLLGMSQKEWVDLLSEPGWFQTLYIVIISLAVLGGGLALNLSLIKKKWTNKIASILTASLSYLFWLALILILLR